MKGNVLTCANPSIRLQVLTVPLVFCLSLMTSLSWPANVAQAQTIYRTTANNGEVTFSDKLPPASAHASVIETGGKPLEPGVVALPFELRQVVNKYPVTLYTSNNCTPCNAGRTLLSNRGIVFTEKTVNTAEDAQALQRVSGESALPLLTLGAQQITGYSDPEWTQFLNAAGYPKSSVLPSGYLNPAATSLVPVPKPVPDGAAETTPAAAPADAQPNGAPGINASNPAGIQF